MKAWDVFYAAFANQCPRCHAAKVFESNNPYNFKKGLTMRKHCVSCGLKYEREVGYFYGAMYVSYALQVALVTLLYLLNMVWWNLNLMVLICIIIACAIALFPVTFRWSRIMWIAFFTPYDETYKGHAFKDSR